MELGSWIFLSSLLLGTVILFVVTKDRWNWKKIVKWVLVATAIAVVSLIAWYGRVLRHERENLKPKPVTVFWGIPLNASKEDVKFLKGVPNDTSVAKSEKNAFNWFYEKEDNDAYHIVVFRHDTLRAVIFVCTQDCWDEPTINGIGIGSPYTKVIELLGDPSSIDHAEDGLTRVFCYADFNSFFYLQKGNVVGYGMYHQAMGSVRLKPLPNKEQFDERDFKEE